MGGVSGRGAAKRWAERGALWSWRALVLVCCALRFVWIADIPFVNDEPKFLAHALEANAQGRIPAIGFLGTRGVDHGPLPMWIYQTLLTITTDPKQMATIKCVVITLLTAWCLFAMGRIPGQRVGPLPWIWFLSVVLWSLSRDLWDQGWTSALFLLAWTAYLRFDDGPSVTRLCGVAATLTALVLNHLLSGSIVIAFVAHCCLRHARWLWRRGTAVLTILVLCGLPSFQYLAHLWATRSAAGVGRAGYCVSCGIDNLQMFAPFVVFGLEDTLREYWWLYPGFSPLISTALGGLRLVSLCGQAFFFCGVILAASNVWRAVRGRSIESRVVTTGDCLALAIWLLHAGVATIEHLPVVWQHLCAMAPVGLHFVCRGAEFTTRFSGRQSTALHATAVWSARGVFVAWVISLATLLFALQWRLHVGHGTKVLPTLGNQWQLAEQLARLPDGTPVFSTALSPQLFPHALATLRALAKTRMTAAQLAVPLAAPDSLVEIRYRLPQDPWDGELVLAIEPAANSQAQGDSHATP